MARSARTGEGGGNGAQLTTPAEPDRLKFFVTMSCSDAPASLGRNRARSTISSRFTNAVMPCSKPLPSMRASTRAHSAEAAHLALVNFCALVRRGRAGVEAQRALVRAQHRHGQHPPRKRPYDGLQAMSGRSPPRFARRCDGLRPTRSPVLSHAAPHKPTRRNNPADRGWLALRSWPCARSQLYRVPRSGGFLAFRPCPARPLLPILAGRRFALPEY